MSLDCPNMLTFTRLVPLDNVKTCPFCGCPDILCNMELYKENDKYFFKMFSVCKYCKTQGPVVDNLDMFTSPITNSKYYGVMKKYKQAVSKAWNNRFTNKYKSKETK